MIDGLRSVVLVDGADAQLLLKMFDALRTRGPITALAADLEARLRKAVVRVSENTANTDVDVRKVDEQQDSGDIAPYDLVDTAEAARILGCTPGNVRDLARRGRIPRHRAGGRWVYPARSVVIRAERQAAKRG